MFIFASNLATNRISLTNSDGQCRTNFSVYSISGNAEPTDNNKWLHNHIHIVSFEYITADFVHNQIEF